MANKRSSSQVEKFRKVARSHQTDESEDAFNAALRKVSRAKPATKEADELAQLIESGDTSPEAMERMAKLIGNKD